MSKIKLNKIDNAQLTEKESGQLRGGAVIRCTCGCCYANNGGSSTGDNTSANAKIGIPTKCSTTTVIVIEL